MGMDDDPDAAAESDEPMTFEDLLEVGFKKCFACDNITRKSLACNEKYLFMMKLYTENASNTRKDAIYRQILEYYDTIIRPELEQVSGRSEPWPLPCIREHFDLHTNFPTDELVNQIRLKKAIRTKLLDNLAHKKPDGTIKFNNNNIRHIINLDKEIVTLLKSKRDISGMVGYNKELDY